MVVFMMIVFRAIFENNGIQNKYFEIDSYCLCRINQQVTLIKSPLTTFNNKSVISVFCLLLIPIATTFSHNPN